MRPYFSLREEGYVFMLIVTYGYVLLIMILMMNMIIDCDYYS